MNSILINFDQTSYFPLSIVKHSHTWCRYGQERSLSGTNNSDHERLSLTSLEVITDALLEIMEVSDSCQYTWSCTETIC